MLCPRAHKNLLGEKVQRCVGHQREKERAQSAPPARPSRTIRAKLWIQVEFRRSGMLRTHCAPWARVARSALDAGAVQRRPW